MANRNEPIKKTSFLSRTGSEVWLPALGLLGPLLLGPKIRRAIFKQPGVLPYADWIAGLGLWSILRLLHGTSPIPFTKLYVKGEPASQKSLYYSLFPPKEKKAYDFSKEAQSGLDVSNIGILTLKQMVENDPTLGVTQRAHAMQLINEAAAGRKTGLISAGDIARAAVGMGLGGATGYLAGKALAGFFNLSAGTRKRLTQIGMLAGLLKNTGVIR